MQSFIPISQSGEDLAKFYADNIAKYEQIIAFRAKNTAEPEKDFIIGQAKKIIEMMQFGLNQIKSREQATIPNG